LRLVCAGLERTPVSTRDQVASGWVVYTCNCGWYDKGHADPTSRGPEIGAQSLREQLVNETGQSSKKTGESGFQVTFTHDLTKYGQRWDEVTRSYFVKRGLSTTQKESVALAIFMEVEVGFEEMQGRSPLVQVPHFGEQLKDSSFSEEDLVSDLIGFYKAFRPGIDPLTLCKPVSIAASLAVWDTYGPVGSHKNKTFTPMFHPCDECRGAARFPAAFQQIAPAEKGILFRDWTVGLDSGSGTINYDEVLPRAG
jgi:hypothetical protein